jgi:predicted enzyme related to lactoylglutathione lyase
MPETPAGTPRLNAVVMDSADPAALAGFYQKLTGLDISYTDDTYVVLGDGPVKIGFQKVEGYQAPGWPDNAKHFHVDFAVDDLEGAAREVISLGAARPEFQPGGESWVVLTDPEGHPFCLCAC